MKILITGASGFLGSWFLDHFIRLNDPNNEIWSVDLVPHPTGIPVDQQDLGDWLADFDEQIDLVFHFASPVGGRMKIEHDPMFNADAFRLDSLIFRWAVTHAKTVVYPSSSAVYPVSLQGKGATILYEDFFHPDATNYGQPDELYGLSKLAGEVMAWKAAEKHGLSTLVIRPFSGYGPGQSHDYPVTAICQRAVDHEDPFLVWGDGWQKRDFVFVSDIVDATMARLDYGFGGYAVMNIASGLGVSFRQVAEMAAQHEGYHADIIMDLSRPTGVQERIGSIREMQRFWTPRTHLSDGIAKTIEWLKSPPVVEEPREIVIDIETDPVAPTPLKRTKRK